MSPRLPEHYTPPEDPGTPLWSTEELLAELKDVALDPLDLPALRFKGAELKDARNHRLRNQITSWLLVHPEAYSQYKSRVSIDSNGLRLEIDGTKEYGKNYRYDVHLPFYEIPPDLLIAIESQNQELESALQDRADEEGVDVESLAEYLVHPNLLLEMRARRARYYGAVDQEAEDQQLFQLGKSLTVHRPESTSRSKYLDGVRNVLGRIVTTRQFTDLLSCLSESEPPHFLPHSFVEHYINTPRSPKGFLMDGNGGSQANRTLKLYEFIQELAMYVEDPAQQRARTGTRELEVEGRPDLHSLRRVQQAADKHILQPSYYTVSQLTDAALLYGEHADSSLVVRTDVDQPDKNNHREMLGIYADRDSVRLMLCPKRHLSIPAQIKWSKINRIPAAKGYDLSRSDQQKLEIWFRPYNRFMQYCETAIMIATGVVEGRVPDAYVEQARKTLSVALQHILDLLHTYVPDFRANECYDLKSTIERAMIDFIPRAQEVYWSIFEKAERESTDFSELAQNLVGAPIRKTFVVGDDFGEQLQDGTIYDEALCRGTEVQVVEISTLNDHEMFKAMRALKIESRDTAFCILGSADVDDQQQERYNRFFDILRQYPINIIANENQAGAGIAVGEANIRQKEETAEMKAENVARVIAIAPISLADYPGNNRLIEDERMWALTTADAIVIAPPEQEENEDISHRYEGIVQAEKLLVKRIVTSGNKQVNILCDGGMHASLKKFNEAIEANENGICIAYEGLGRFGALLGRLLEDGIPPHPKISVFVKNTPENDDELNNLYQLVQTKIGSVEPHFQERLYKELMCKPGRISSIDETSDPVKLRANLQELVKFFENYKEHGDRIFVCSNEADLERDLDQVFGTEKKRVIPRPEKTL